MVIIELNNKKFSATPECAEVLKANSDCNQTMSFLISLSLLSGALIELN